MLKVTILALIGFGFSTTKLTRIIKKLSILSKTWFIPDSIVPSLDYSTLLYLRKEFIIPVVSILAGVNFTTYFTKWGVHEPNSLAWLN